MALRLLLSSRILTAQRTSLIRCCRCYSSLMYDQRSLSHSVASSSATLYAHPLPNIPSLLATQRRYVLAFQSASFSSSSSSSSGSPPSSDDSAPSDGHSSSFSSSNDGKNRNNDDDGSHDSSENTMPVVIQPGNPLMPVEVPENYPIIPLIPVSRHPLFPKFIKMLEITNKDLVELIRRKVKLNQPYAGVFLRKEPAASDEKTSTTETKSSDTNKDKQKSSTTVTADVVKNLDEVYKIGAFVQIHEVHDMGDRLRMIVMAHRRIKLVGIAADEAVIEEVDRRRPTQKVNGNRRRSRRKGESERRRDSRKYQRMYFLPRRGIDHRRKRAFWTGITNTHTLTNR